MSTPLRCAPSIVVACPDCGMAGQVRFDQLPHVMHCPNCSVRFWIDRSGKVKSETEVTCIRFVCPRCGHRERVPVEFLTRPLDCRECRGRFRWGGDHRFHPLERPRHNPTEQETPKPHVPRRILGWPAKRWGIVGAVTSIGLFLVAASLLLRLSLEPSITAAALEFTRDCANHNREAAGAWLLAGQQHDFDRWYSLTFPQFCDPLATKPSKLDIFVFEIQAETDIACIRLVLQEPGRGRRLQTQYWRLEDGRWKFDAGRTLSSFHSGNG